MKTNYIYAVLLSLLFSTFWGCSDWTETESEDYFEYPGADYYANLRNYKQTDHQVAFGWFGNWTGLGASMVNSMMGLPDSVDFVSIWGNWRNLDEARMADKRKVKELKGTRALVCFIIQNIGDQLTPQGQTAEEYWGWDSSSAAPDNPANLAAIEKYALSLIHI